MDTQYLFKQENLFNMENIISERLIQVISDNKTTFSDDILMSSYENAIKEFDELVEKGFAKKRENNLLSITDAHLHRITLESYKNRLSLHELGNSGVDLAINKSNFNTFGEH